MATERIRRRAAAAALFAFCALAFPAPAAADEPWWVQVAFPGHAVLQVRANDDTIAVAVDGAGQQQSDDAGRTWHPIFERHGLVIQPGPTWRPVDSHPGQAGPGGTWRADPGSPVLGDSRSATDAGGLLAAPASLPGVVVAVDRDNLVWRRGADGRGARALLLLPQGMAAGPPRVTAVAAFDSKPLSDTVYMATDGYSVLESLNGGDDWIRAGPGLPDRVYALFTDPTTRSIYAGTSDGLWVHHLRALPAPPVYPDAALRWRWLGIALVTLASSAAAVAGLLRALR